MTLILLLHPKASKITLNENTLNFFILFRDIDDAKGLEDLNQSVTQ